MRRHRCATCDVVLYESRVDKLGSADERWHVDSPPKAARVRAPASSRAPSCERCGGTLFVAMPEGHVPAPAYAFAERPPRLTVNVDTQCSKCGASGLWSPHA